MSLAMYTTEQEKEKYILFKISDKDDLDELAALVDTAGGEVVGRVTQDMDKPHPALYLGTGKVKWLKEYADFCKADGIVCDDELTPAQHKNLAEMMKPMKVLDRTLIILDIFAKHATTKEGKLQVEMAQLTYRLAHLSGIGISLSRQGGGIGTRGPGEKKLETDRRALRKRIAFLRHEIEDLKRNRDISRQKRMNDLRPIISIVGYTNAGKSTLLNALTKSDVLEEDALFATLDPTTRRCKMENGQEVLFTDTVGFIDKLPHHLIDAFRSTLEEVRYADILMHVVDGSSEDVDNHMKVVYETLDTLNITDKPIITVINKSDLIKEDKLFTDVHAKAIVHISAKKKLGLDDLLKEIMNLVNEERIWIDTIYPYDKATAISLIHQYGQVVSEEYEEDGIHIQAYVPKRFLDKK
ncbi:MAG: GTPase HflX [Faecalicoccus sp.]|nr:GTPase HflX [Faecalicoccus sp.]